MPPSAYSEFVDGGLSGGITMNENTDFMKRITAAERDSLVSSGVLYTIYDVVNNERTLVIKQCVEFLRERANVYKGGPKVCLQSAADALEETIEGEKDA